MDDESTMLREELLEAQVPLTHMFLFLPPNAPLMRGRSSEIMGGIGIS